MAAKVITASATVALLWVSAASASSLSNRDVKTYNVTIIEGETTTGQVLGPSAALEGICTKGCVIRLNDDVNSEYELHGSEVVSIEGGYLYYDGPPATAVPKVGGAPAPAEPKGK